VQSSADDVSSKANDKPLKTSATKKLSETKSQQKPPQAKLKTEVTEQTQSTSEHGQQALG
jgi:hypothetical protein